MDVQWKSKITFSIRLLIWMLFLQFIVEVESTERKRNVDKLKYQDFSTNKECTKSKKSNLCSQFRFRPYGSKDSDTIKYVYFSEVPSNDMVVNEEPKHSDVYVEDKLLIENDPMMSQNIFESTYDDSTQLMNDSELSCLFDGNSDLSTSITESLGDDIFEGIEFGDNLSLSLDDHLFKTIVDDLFNDETLISMKEEFNIENQEINNVSNVSIESPSENENEERYIENKRYMEDRSREPNESDKNMSVDSSEMSSFSSIIESERTYDFSTLIESTSDNDKNKNNSKENSSMERNTNEDIDINEISKEFFQKYQEETQSFKKLYSSVFIKIAPNLSNINDYIKEANPTDINKAAFWFYSLNKDKRFKLHYIDFELCYTDPCKYEKSLGVLFSKIESINKFMYCSRSKNDPTAFLNTSVCAKLYIQLLMNYSLRVGLNLRNYLKKMYLKKEHDFIFVYKKITKLPKLKDDLIVIFSRLEVSSQEKNPIYKLQYFYKIIFQMYESPGVTSTNNFLSEISNVIKEIIENYKVMCSLNQKIIYYKYTNIEKLVSASDIRKSKKCIDNVQGLLNNIMSQMEELKEKVKNNLKDPETQRDFIFYHLSCLMLQRLLNVKIRKTDFSNSFKVYKNMLEKYIFLFYKVRESTNFDYMTKSQKEILYNNEETLQYIISYIFLNIIKISLMEINKKHNECIVVIERSHEHGIKSVKEKEFEDSVNSLIYTVNCISHLKEILLGFERNRIMIERFMRVFIIEDEINAIVKKTKDELKLSNKKDIYVTDDIYLSLENRFHKLLRLHKILYYLVYNKL